MKSTTKELKHLGIYNVNAHKIYFNRSPFSVLVVGVVYIYDHCKQFIKKFVLIFLLKCRKTISVYTNFFGSF